MGGRLVLAVALVVALLANGAALADACGDARTALQGNLQSVAAGQKQAAGVSENIKRTENFFRNFVGRCEAAKKAGNEKMRVFNLGESGAMWGQRANYLKHRAAIHQGLLTAIGRVEASLNSVASACAKVEGVQGFLDRTKPKVAQDKARFSQALEKDKRLIKQFGSPWSSVQNKVACSTPGAPTAPQSADGELGAIRVINASGYNLEIVPLGRLSTKRFSVPAGKTITIDKKKLLRKDGGMEHFTSTLVAAGGGVWKGDPAAYQNQKVCTKRDFKRTGQDDWKVEGGVAKGCSIK